MTTYAYISERQKYQRPQAVLFSENPGILVNGSYIPDGIEEQASGTILTTDSRFLILSDHNRDPINLKPTRIEQRQRTVNGRMRSIHIADKFTLSLSWTLLPSRAFNGNPSFDQTTGITSATEYTVDGGAGGIELLDWYENHKGSFYVFLAYDKYNEFTDTEQYGHLGQYNQVLEMFVSDFSYTVQKRGMTNHDLWNISITLEEA